MAEILNTSTFEVSGPAGTPPYHVLVYTNLYKATLASSINTDEAVLPAVVLVSSCNSSGRGIAIRDGVILNEFGFNKGQPVYVGVDGSLTQIPPDAGYIRIIGVALEPNALQVIIHPGIVVA